MATVLLAGGCGYVGDPLPPALNIPLAVTDLAAVQRGSRIIVQCTLPEMTTDGLRLARLGAVDLRIGSEGVRPWLQETWEAQAAGIQTDPAPAPGAIRVETAAANWAGKEVILGVRVSSPKGRWSEWSNLYALNVVAPVPAPSGLIVAGVRDGVQLRWLFNGSRPNVRFRVYRRAADAQEFSFVGEQSESEWIDSNTRYGQRYEYLVQAVLPAGDDVAESDLSEPVTVTPEDRFPPAVPAGLRAVPGLDSIELTWDRDPEAGTKYRLFRRDENGQERSFAQALELPGYSDREIESGKRYFYSVSAVDMPGNESDRSAAVEAVAP